MRFLVAMLALLGALIGYGAYRQRKATLARISQVAALQDSLQRADSLQQVADVRVARMTADSQRLQVPPSANDMRSRDRLASLKLPKPERKVFVREPAPTNRPR